MKANELMIGDWVWYDNQPHQIRQLGVFGENRDGDSYPAVCVGKPNGIGLMLERNEIDPIPLTPKILEKNGFTLKEEEKGMYGVAIAPYYTRDDVPFEVFCDGEPFAIWFKDPVNIKYVHQLQHAIRLCGIEKEIIL